MTEHSKGEVLPLFPTPLYTYKAEGNQYVDIQEEVSKVVTGLYESALWGQNPQWDSTTHFLSNRGNFVECLLEEKSMKVLTEFILEHCKYYMQMMNVGDIYTPAIESSWLTLTKPGLHAHIHDHGLNQISGVYWFKTNGQDGNIFFRNALKALKANPIGSSIGNESQFQPEQGRIVMWPGFLDHGVYENKTNEDRISLSFNLQLHRRSK